MIQIWYFHGSLLFRSYKSFYISDTEW